MTYPDYIDITIEHLRTAKNSNFSQFSIVIEEKLG